MEHDEFAKKTAIEWRKENTEKLIRQWMKIYVIGINGSGGKKNTHSKQLNHIRANLDHNYFSIEFDAQLDGAKNELKTNANWTDRQEKKGNEKRKFPFLSQMKVTC